jgi:phage replication O-like protein O
VEIKNVTNSNLANPAVPVNPKEEIEIEKDLRALQRKAQIMKDPLRLARIKAAAKEKLAQREKGKAEKARAKAVEALNRIKKERGERAKLETETEPVTIPPPETKPPRTPEFTVEAAFIPNEPASVLSAGSPGSSGPQRVTTPSESQQDAPTAPEPEMMASPQAEDGHIDIANELAEVLARTKLSADESRILWAILRKSWGWHRKMAPISITKFQELTGMDRKSVCRILTRLLRRRIIKKDIETKKKFKRHSGDSATTESITYGFQKDYFKWRDSGSTATPVAVQPPKRVALQPLPSDRKPLVDKGQRFPKESKEKTHVRFPENSVPLKLANLLLMEVRKNKPNLKEPNLQRWARDIDLLLRRDKRSEEEVERVIRWACADHEDGTGKWKGWATVILSAGNLRDKFDRIELKMEATLGGKSKSTW